MPNFSCNKFAYCMAKSILSLCVLFLVSGNQVSHGRPLEWEIKGDIQGDSSARPLDPEGYQLLNLMAARAEMRLVSSFDDLMKNDTGVLFLLGNAHPPVSWGEMETWIRRGGIVVVAFDQAPPRAIQNRLAAWTGFQWSNLRLKYMGDKGIELLPERSFVEIQKLVPFEWSFGAMGESLTRGARNSGMGHSNSPSFLISIDTLRSNPTIFARLPGTVELDIAQGISMRLPAFRADFGVVANLGRGKVIQVADPDIFSNQMLELEGNFQFAWSVLQSIQKDKAIAPGDFPVMIIGQHVESAVYTLPLPPVPLPELDLFQLASLGTRALDEKLPDLEKPGGLFERISSRIALRVNWIFLMVAGAILFAIIGFWFFFSQRSSYKSRQIATKTYNEVKTKSENFQADKSQASIEVARQNILTSLKNAQSGLELPIWALGDLCQGKSTDERMETGSKTGNIKRAKAAWRLMDWINRGVPTKPGKINKAMSSILAGAYSQSICLFSPGKTPK